MNSLLMFTGWDDFSGNINYCVLNKFSNRIYQFENNSQLVLTAVWSKLCDRFNYYLDWIPWWHEVVIEINSLIKLSTGNEKMKSNFKFLAVVNILYIYNAIFTGKCFYRCFPVNVAKLSRTACFIDHLQWLLL